MDFAFNLLDAYPNPICNGSQNTSHRKLFLLWTKKLPELIKITVGIGIGAAILGYYLAYLFDSSIAGMIVSVAGIAFLGSALIKSKWLNATFGTSLEKESFEI